MIEDIIKANTEAINRNTEVLLQILAASGGAAPAAVETATPAPAKAEKPKAEKKEKPAAKAEPKLEVVEKDPDLDNGDDSSETLTHEILVGKIQGKLGAATGDQLAAVKSGFKALREKFGVATIKDLTEDQFAEFAEGIAAL